MRFARWVLAIAGIFGVIVIAPMFVLEDVFARGTALSHPENYYGFVAVTLAWQLTYLLIATDPVRYRPVILLGALGKAIFAAALWALHALGRIPVELPLFALSDVLIAVLFVAAWVKTGPSVRR